MALLFRLVIGFSFLATASCKPLQAIGGNNSQTMHREVSKSQKDSVFIHLVDSIVIHDKGDTVFFDRWRIRYRDRWLARSDTVRVFDSVHIEKPVLVEKKLSGWKNFQLWSGRIALVVLAIFLAYRMVKRYIRF